MPFDRLKRRDFITLLGGAGAWPLTARAQQQPVPVIGFLHPTSPEPNADRLRAFSQGLKEAGFVEGANVAIEYRWADGHNDRLPALAADLVHRKGTVIVSSLGTPTALAAKAATTAVPIVVVTRANPVRDHLVTSLNRPGANVTGVTFLANELGPKRLDLLRQLVPNATTIAMLVNPGSPETEAGKTPMRPSWMQCR